MCFINPSENLGGSLNSNDEGNMVEVFLYENFVVPANGVIGYFEFEIRNEENNIEEENEATNDEDFTAYEWMAKTDLEEFDKEVW